MCDFKEGATIIHHDKPSKYDITPCDGDKCFTIDVNYNDVTLRNIKDLLSVSEHCYQEITFDCVLAELTDYATWTGADGNHHEYFTNNESNSCQCDKTDSCLSKNQRKPVSCNCDYKDSSPRQDKIRITSKKDLPLKSFHYEHLGPAPHHAGSVQIGPLVCQGLDLCNDVVMHYNILNDPMRSLDSQESDNGTFSDCNVEDIDSCLDALDDWSGAGWYRFMEPAGTMLQAFKKDGKRCASGPNNIQAFAGPYSETYRIDYPSAGESKEVPICRISYDWSLQCKSRFDIDRTMLMKNCGNYYVYYLKPFDSCPDCRFCAE